MKLLLDENISDRIVAHLSDLFPGSTHVNDAGLAQADDSAIWDWARQNDYAIVSKDTDFAARVVAFGPPPKLVWLRVGNCTTATIVDLLRARHAVVDEFLADERDGLLVLERLA